MTSKEEVEKRRQTGSRSLERTAGEGREQNRKDHAPDVRQSALALEAGGLTCRVLLVREYHRLINEIKLDV